MAEPQNDQGVSLTAITKGAFDAYNGGGPPDRANLTHDGKPVPPFTATGPSVQHKWTCATAHAACSGARYIVGLVALGQHDPAKLLASMEAVLGAPGWVPTIRFEAELLAKAFEEKAGDTQAQAKARMLRELSTLPGVADEPAPFFAAALRELVQREPADDKAKARTALLAELLDAWPSQEPVPLVGAVTVWSAIASALPGGQQGLFYRTEAEHLASLVS